MYKKQQEKKANNLRIQKEKQRIAAEKKQQEKERVQHILKQREEQYGDLTKMIKIKYDKPLEDIAIYSKSKVIFIENKTYKFADIISCELDLKTEVIKGKEKIYHTTPSQWEKAQYEAEHWLSGKKLVTKTTVVREPDVHLNKYAIFISINDLSSPTIRIDCGKDSELANEINSTFKVIINQNNK